MRGHVAFGSLIVACATLLTMFDAMTINQWVVTVQWIFVVFVGGHAVATIFARRRIELPRATTLSDRLLNFEHHRTPRGR
jgi:hypothetical protein